MTRPAGTTENRPHRYGVAAAASALIVALLLLLPLNPAMPRIGLDPSWCAALNEAVARHLVFGRDVIFTFGPLASVYTQTYHPAVDGLMLAFGALTAAGLCAACALAVPASRSWLLVLLPLIVAETTQRDAPFDRDAMFYALTFAFLLATLRLTLPRRHALRLAPTPPVVAAYGLAACAVAVLPLVKLSFAAAAAVAGALACIALLRCRPAAAFGCALLMPAALCSAWLASGQPLDALPGYFTAALPIVGGYAEAMSLPGSSLGCAVYLCASLWFAATLPRSFGRDAIWAAALACCGCAAVLFLGFKAGLVRHDQHATTAAGVLLFCGFLTAALADRRRALATGAIAFAAWLMVDLTAGPVGLGPGVARVASAVHGVVRGIDVRWIRHDALARAFDRSNASIRAALPLPPVDGSVDVYPTELSTLFAHGLQWAGRPVPQSYSAYTPALDRLNAAHLQGTAAPDHVFFQVAPIDDRLPTLEDAGSWPVLLSRYAAVGYDGAFVHLVRRRTATSAEETAVSADTPTVTTHAALGAAVAIPWEGPVLAAVELRPTVAGRMLQTLFKLPRVQIELTLADGQIVRRRYVPEMGLHGLLISPYIGSTDDFLLTAAGRNAERRVRSIRLLASATWWRTSFDVRFVPLRLPVQTAALDLLKRRSAVPPAAVLSPLPKPAFEAVR